jgi:hypothetical protein
MNDSELIKLWKNIEKIMYIATQGEAKQLIAQLKFDVNILKSKINNPDAFKKLKSVVSSAESASGRVKDKENWISYTEEDWETFKSMINCK